VRAVVTDASETLTLELYEPQAAVTPGQSAVLFDDHDHVLGGGRIVSASSRQAV
jgi:tRNA U34 2-thiouridine synthase MnmA/TrmU